MARDDRGGLRGEMKQLFAAKISVGVRMERAADECNISERTAWRWLADPEVRREINKLRDQYVEAALSGLQTALGHGVLALVNLAQEGQADGIRLRAAIAIIELGLRGREHLMLTERVAALEEAGRHNGKAKS